MKQPSEEADAYIMEFMRTVYQDTRHEIPLEENFEVYTEQYDNECCSLTLLAFTAMMFCVRAGLLEGYVELVPPQGVRAAPCLHELLDKHYYKLGAWGKTPMDMRAARNLIEDWAHESHADAYLTKRKLNALLGE